jgi:hypothetical protein
MLKWQLDAQRASPVTRSPIVMRTHGCRLLLEARVAHAGQGRADALASSRPAVGLDEYDAGLIGLFGAAAFSRLIDSGE